MLSFLFWQVDFEFFEIFFGGHLRNIMINSILDIMYLAMPSASRGLLVLVFSNVG
jgi:hypothetical protein